MKRLALALAAAVLGAGCGGSHHCVSTMSVSWSFLMFDGTTTTSCATAGVTWVDIYVDGNLVVNSADCTAGGVVIEAVAPGAHALTVEGIDSSGAVAYRHQLNANGPNACTNVQVAAQPGEGTADLNYSTATGCIASPCYLWFSVVDTVSNTVAAAISTSSPAGVKTQFVYPGNVVIRLPEGSFRLDWMELVSGATTPFAGEAITCNAANFDIAAAAQTSVPAALSCAP